MLRPERMSRISVTGSKSVMDDVIETVYDSHLLDLSNYNDSWEGFEPGTPLEGADEASNRLVTVRSLKSILDIEEGNGTDFGRSLNDDDALASELEELRQETNALDDRREELDDEEDRIDQRLDAAETLVDLGIDLDLLWGYDSLVVRVGEADPNAVADALEEYDGIEAFETFTGDGIVAVFARPAAESGDALENALVSVRFDDIEVPEEEGDPEAYVEQLRERKREIEVDRDTVEDDLNDLAEEKREFLLAAEETLTIEVQKREAPLTFATTKNAFVAEGWIPTERFVDLAEALEASVGDHIELEELERASYNGEGRATGREPTEGSVGDPEAVTDGGERTRSDGGTDIPMADRGPPVVQRNPEPMKPFETLVRTVNRPKYTEIDPTVILFLTLPLMFGFMIGDVGYGAIYTVVGYALYRRADNDAVTSLGVIAIWGGVLTMLFGFFYGEIFGYRAISHVFWEGIVGLSHAPIEKGLMPGALAYAELWLVMSVLFGIAHMTIGYVFDFVDNLAAGVTTAILESGSWLILMLGVWIWIFSTTAQGAKPELLFTVFNGNPIPLGFAGFSETVGWVALGVGLIVGLVLVVLNEVNHFGGIGVVVGVFESLRVVVDALSYTRLAAEVLAEVGLAFAVNLLFWGAYQQEGEFHFLIGHGPQTIPEGASLMFPG